MGTFFRGWRRKLGGVTLVIACLFMAGWIRSAKISDNLFNLDPSGSTSLESVRGAIILRRIRVLSSEFYGTPTTDAGTWKFSARDDIDTMSADEWDARPFHPRWRWHFAGIQFGEGVMGKEYRFAKHIIPYWSIVAPLTAFSAYLLLSKPRKSISETLEN